MGLSDHNVSDLYRLLAMGEISSAEIVHDCAERIEALEPRLHALLAVDPDRALADAASSDQLRADGQALGRVAGIPCAVKDNMVTEGWATTCGSRILDGYVPVYDATAVSRLKDAGSIILGKANMDEFAFGSSTENSAFGVTRNPWDTERVPGGSSGGSAAAVAAGMVPFALGSDTGGSIRQPASFCGVVGMKPTYGLVSRYGLVAFASSLDQIGPFARNVLDCAIVLQAIAGHDPRDSTSIPRDVHEPPDYTAELGGGVKGLRVGYPKELMGEGLSGDVRDAVTRSLGIFEKMGAAVEEVSLPSLAYAVPVYYLIAPAEASSNLARFDGVRYGLRVPGVDDIIEMYEKTRAEGLGAEAKRRIMLGTYALSAGYYDAYYGQAQKVRTMIAADLAKAFETYDILLSPTAPTTAFAIGEKANDPLAMYLSDICTIPVNLAGIPAVSIPCGLAGGLPVGLQIMGPHFAEASILGAAYAFEQELALDARPPILAGFPLDRVEAPPDRGHFPQDARDLLPPEAFEGGLGEDGGNGDGGNGEGAAR
jgi:aspartyl-tRNA(Asn)/glutamyl-tRNA(Gln) amidotransferase subunit A